MMPGLCMPGLHSGVGSENRAEEGRALVRARAACVPGAGAECLESPGTFVPAEGELRGPGSLIAPPEWHHV